MRFIKPRFEELVVVVNDPKVGLGLGTVVRTDRTGPLDVSEPIDADILDVEPEDCRSRRPRAGGSTRGREVTR